MTRNRSNDDHAPAPTPEEDRGASAASPEGPTASPDEAGGAPSDRARDDESTDADPVAALQRELDDLRARYQRSLADLENTRKRHRREMEDAHHYGISNLARELLEIADNLDRAIEGASEDERSSGFFQGVEMVRDEFRKVLSRHGVVEVDAVGQPFDPMVHNAIMEDPRDDVAPGTVTEELIKGYRIKDRLLRAAMVKVAAQKTDGEASEEGSPRDTEGAEPSARSGDSNGS